MAALPKQGALAKGTSRYAAAPADIDLASVTNREDWTQLPVIRKVALIDLQTPEGPFGGLNATAVNGMARLFMSPGPIAESQGRRDDFSRFAWSLFAAGFRAGDVVESCFSYHLTPASMMFDSAAQALGCAVFPEGISQTEQQVAATVHFKPVGDGGTPDFLQIILEKGDELDADLSSVEKTLVGGGALLPSL
jgi:phenylacetate-CoA ligase